MSYGQQHLPAQPCSLPGVARPLSSFYCDDASGGEDQGLRGPGVSVPKGVVAQGHPVTQPALSVPGSGWCSLGCRDESDTDVILGRWWEVGYGAPGRCSEGCREGSIDLPRISSGGRAAGPGKDSMPQPARTLNAQVSGMLSGQLSL